MANRVKVPFAGREVTFTDRDAAIKWVEGLAEKGTDVVYVIYGPEGCGKTAFLKQAMEILSEHGYSVVHVNPMADKPEESLMFTKELKELLRNLPYPAATAAQPIDLAVELLYRSIERGIRRRIALLADGVFQAIGLDKAEILVKRLLNMIEWPSIRYDKMVVLVVSSEGASRERIGRHRWAKIRIMWNMGREGFSQLYRQLGVERPTVDEAWRLTGGNPKMLSELHGNGWNVDRTIADMVSLRDLTRLVANLSDTEREILREVIDDPDVILHRIREAGELERILIDKNLMVRVFEHRDPYLWIDEVPPDKDPELGIGKYYAWQTPLHREAVRRTLESLGIPPQVK